MRQGIKPQLFNQRSAGFHDIIVNAGKVFSTSGPTDKLHMNAGQACLGCFLAKPFQCIHCLLHAAKSGYEILQRVDADNRFTIYAVIILFRKVLFYPPFSNDFKLLSIHGALPDNFLCDIT